MRAAVDSTVMTDFPLLDNFSSIVLTAGRFFGRLKLSHFPERSERPIPKSIEPLAQGADSPGVDGVDPAGALRAILYQARRLEHPQMLRYRRAADIQTGGELANRTRPPAQTFEHRPPGRIAERVEDAIFVSHG